MPEYKVDTIGPDGHEYDIIIEAIDEEAAMDLAETGGHGALRAQRIRRSGGLSSGEELVEVYKSNWLPPLALLVMGALLVLASTGRV